MDGGFSLGRILGYPVFVNWSAIFILAFIVVSGGTDDPRQLMMSLGFGLAVFLSILVHELGHAVVATRMFELGPAKILLHGFGGLTQYSRAPGPKQGLVTAAAGPMAGLALGALALVAELSLASVLPAFAVSLLGTLVFINIFWSLFNLLPMYPMDGGSVLNHGLTMMLGGGRARKITRVVSIATAVVVGLVGWFYLGSIFIAIVAAFIVVQNVQSRG